MQQSRHSALFSPTVIIAGHGADPFSRHTKRVLSSIYLATTCPWKSQCNLQKLQETCSAACYKNPWVYSYLSLFSFPSYSAIRFCELFTSYFFPYISAALKPTFSLPGFPSQFPMAWHKRSSKQQGLSKVKSRVDALPSQ